MRDLCRLIGWTVVDLFRSRATLEAEIWALRQQINVLRRTAPTKHAFSAIDRLIFVGLYWLFPKIREALAIVKPETVVRWHRAGFRSYWRWKSRARGCLLLSYMNYYNEVRTHLSLEKDSPVSRNVQRAGHILFLCRPVLAGCITYIFGFDLRQARSCGDRAPISWHTKSIAKLSGSQLPKHDPQIEAVCADGGERDIRSLRLRRTPTPPEAARQPGVARAAHFCATCLCDLPFLPMVTGAD